MGPQEPGLVSGDLCVCVLHGTTEQETNCAGDIVSQVSKTMRIQGEVRGTRAAGEMWEREAGVGGMQRCEPVSVFASPALRRKRPGPARRPETGSGSGYLAVFDSLRPPVLLGLNHIQTFQLRPLGPQSAFQESRG